MQNIFARNSKTKHKISKFLAHIEFDLLLLLPRAPNYREIHLFFTLLLGVLWYKVMKHWSLVTQFYHQPITICTLTSKS